MYSNTTLAINGLKKNSSRPTRVSTSVSNETHEQMPSLSSRLVREVFLCGELASLMRSWRIRVVVEAKKHGDGDVDKVGPMRLMSLWRHPISATSLRHS